MVVVNSVSEATKLNFSVLLKSQLRIYSWCMIKSLLQPNLIRSSSKWRKITKSQSQVNLRTTCLANRVTLQRRGKTCQIGRQGPRTTTRTRPWWSDNQLTTGRPSMAQPLGKVLWAMGAMKTTILASVARTERTSHNSLRRRCCSPETIHSVKSLRQRQLKRQSRCMISM